MTLRFAGLDRLMKTMRRHSTANQTSAMSTPLLPIERRRVLRRLALGLGAPWSTGVLAQTAQRAPALVTKPIPSSGETLPVVGLGTWITFNVGTTAPRAMAVPRS